MTITKIQSKKKNCNLQTLQLSGSQINLSPRPMPGTHNSTWSTSSKTYPIRRSVSAFGFQQRNEERGHHLNRSRPLSADNIRYVNQQNFTDDYRSEITVSSRSRSRDEVDHAETSVLSGNMYENILNGYSENKLIERHAKTESANNLKPGLSSKPPLPPFANDNAKAYGSKNEPELKTENLAENDENLKTAAEKEAFDDIIALKFQRWFPNTIGLSHGYRHSLDQNEGSSSDGAVGGGEETEDVELVSYKERNYKTCEYRRYEVLRKNTTKKIGIMSTSNANASKHNVKKKRSKVKAQSVRNNVALSTNHQKQPACVSALEIEAIASSQLTDSATQRDSVSQINHEHGDCRKLAEKLDEPCRKNIDTNVIATHPKASSFKKSNSHSSHVNQLKKHKKISFFVDEVDDDEGKVGKDNDDAGHGVGDDGSNNDKNSSSDFADTYFATKKSSTPPPKSLTYEQNAVNDAKCTRNHTLPNTVVSNHDRNATVSPQQPAGSQIEDVQSWMCTHCSVQADTNYNQGTKTIETNNSMYEEMMDILKDIENEDIKKENTKTIEDAGRHTLTPTSSARAMWSLIEEAEKANDMIKNGDLDSKMTYQQSCMQTPNILLSNRQPQEANLENKPWNRLSDLLRLSSAELAQKAMSLQLLLNEKENVLQNLNFRFKTIEQTHQHKMQQLEYSIQKQLKLVEQLKIEKKSISEKMQNTINDLEKKHATALVTLDEKYKMELKKSLEKQAAADKLERDKWLEIKTQKIRDLTIKGLEPELNRMAAAHQEEIAEIRKFHKRQIEDAEEATCRRMAVQKEKLDAEKEKALAIEREISRQKLADEIGELEKRYQEQRKRLLAEVHVERENMERQNEATLAIREKENERKWERKSIEMHKKIEALQQQHQEEIRKIQQNFESEKQLWMKNQIMELSDRENRIREQCKKERDKHIELIVQKLESENTERETTSEQKIKRLKEKYEAEIRDLEAINENSKRKLNESRTDIQKNEDCVSQLRAQLNQIQTEYIILKEKYERLLAEQDEMQTVAKSELTTRIHILQSELSQAQLTYESQFKMLKSENERQLSQMYNKVKEMIDKKDYIIKTLNDQKDAALKQCNQLEELLQLRRKNDVIS